MCVCIYNINKCIINIVLVENLLHTIEKKKKQYYYYYYYAFDMSNIQNAVTLTI